MGRESLIMDEGRAMIGQQVGPGEPFSVEREAIRRFSEAIMEEPSNFFGGEHPQSGTAQGVAPLTFPLYNCRDGIDRDFQIPLSAPRRVRGGDEFEFLAPVHVGDEIRATTKLLDLYERKGDTGRMVFIVTETNYVNQRGETVMVNRATVIRR